MRQGHCCAILCQICLTCLNRVVSLRAVWTNCLRNLVLTGREYVTGHSLRQCFPCGGALKILTRSRRLPLLVPNCWLQLKSRPILSQCSRKGDPRYGADHPSIFYSDLNESIY